MKDLKKGLKEFTEILKKARDKGELKGYALIGGVAVSARARPRATKDIDFLINADKSFLANDLPKLISAKGYKFKIFKSNALDPLNGVIRVFDRDGSEFVDLIPVFWKWHVEAVDNAEEIEVFDGLRVPIARTEELIVMKLKAGGPQDVLDVEELLKAAGASDDLDKDRLLEVAKRAGVGRKLHALMKETG